MSHYFIKAGYITNRNSFKEYIDNEENSSLYQNVIYQYAQKIIKKKKVKSVLDIGCGYGHKLKKYIYPVCQNITGIDLEQAIRYCRNKYNFGEWIIDDIENSRLSFDKKYDLIIASDVIEHLINPDNLFSFIERFMHSNTLIIFSTPDRRYSRRPMGPPNVEHIREWSRKEFRKYVRSHNYKVINHFLFKSKDSVVRKNSQVLLAKKSKIIFILNIIKRTTKKMIKSFNLKINKKLFNFLHYEYVYKKNKNMVKYIFWLWERLFGVQRVVLSNLDYIIVGSPRSGTGFMSRLLSKNKIECGHEKIFSIYYFSYLTIDKDKDYRAESSFLAAPFLKNYYKQYKIKNDIKIIHITRHPLLVISSLYNLGFFSDLRKEDKIHMLYIEFIERYLPEIKKIKKEIERCVYFWITWNNFIEKELKDIKGYFRCKIEDITEDPQGFFDDVLSEKINYKVAIPNKTYNNKRNEKIRNKKITINDIHNKKLKKELIMLAKKYGYNI